MKNKITATVIMCAILTSSIGISTRADDDDSWLMGFAQCNSQLNIRKSPDTNSDIIGLLDNNDLVYVESTDEYGWSKSFLEELKAMLPQNILQQVRPQIKLLRKLVIQQQKQELQH